MKLRTISLDDESDAILLRRSQEVGNISLAARQLLKEAELNNTTLRHALRGMINTIGLNCRLVRQGIHTPGVLAFVAEIEQAAKMMEKRLERQALNQLPIKQMGNTTKTRN